MIIRAELRISYVLAGAKTHSIQSNYVGTTKQFAEKLSAPVFCRRLKPTQKRK
jgi:hypothetical protein